MSEEIKPNTSCPHSPPHYPLEGWPQRWIGNRKKGQSGQIYEHGGFLNSTLDFKVTRRGGGGGGWDRGRRGGGDRGRGKNEGLDRVLKFLHSNGGALRLQTFTKKEINIKKRFESILEKLVTSGGLYILLSRHNSIKITSKILIFKVETLIYADFEGAMKLLSIFWDLSWSKQRQTHMECLCYFTNGTR